MTDMSNAVAPGSPAATVIVPFHRGLAGLERVVAATLASSPDVEVVVVANGHREDLSAIEQTPRVRVVSLPHACGPAIARNRGADVAAGPILVFIDADVVPHPTAIPLMQAVLADEAVTGVFGAYDHEPDDRRFYSQYRNLAHAFVHEQGRPEARTFWAGLGAVRAAAFRAVGGFDERFVRPSIEDIELGYRLTGAGYRLRLDPRIRGTHLKRWTLTSSIVTDVRDRGVPWTQALLKFGAVANDLNISWSGRASVALAYLIAASLVVSIAWPWALAIAATALAGFAAAHWPLLAAFVRVRGVGFALGVVAGQLVHHLCNGVSFVVGTGLWIAQRLLGWRAKWTLPPDAWRSGV